MIRRLRITALGFVLVAPVAAHGNAASAGGPAMAIELESIENIIDGCGACGSHVNGRLEPGQVREWCGAPTGTMTATTR